MSAVDVRIVTSLAEMASLRDEWDVLSAALGSPLLDHDWFLSAAESLHEERDLQVVTVREGGRLVAVAPMALNRADRHLVILGTGALYEPSGWLYSSESSLRHLAVAVASVGEVAVLDRVPASSPLCTLLPQLLRSQAVTIVREAAPSFAVRTDQSWPALSALLSSRTRHRFESTWSRAGLVAGNLRLEELKPGPAEVREVFAQLVALEAGGWKGQAGSALAVKPALSQFFQGYVHRAAERGRLRVTRLWIGDVTAAAELAVEAYGRRWGLKLAYDEQFARWAPALQVVHASIKACTDRGLTAYEFLGSAESWQKRWKPEERRYAFTVMYPLSGRAAATAVKDLTSMLARRFRSPMRLFPVTT